LPLAFARELQQAGVHLPRTAPSAFARDELVLAPDNGDPTARSRYFMLRDSVTSDATATGDTPPAAANAWMVDVYLNEVLRHTPDLTVLWLRNPDSTQHAYGVGSPEFHSALREQDALLGRVVARLDSLGMSATTDVIVVSDHGHSNIAGARDLFPLRQIQGGDVGGVDNEHGYSVSGSIRMAHELTTIARIPAFDGQGALYTPVMSGIRADGSRLVPARHDDAGGRPRTYTTPGYVVPDSLPQGALVLAPNGGTEYFYQPEHDVEVVKRAVRFLQSREYVAAVFVAARYGSLPGTLPAASVDLENASRGPDIIVSYTWNDAKIQGFPGTEYSTTFADVPNERGEHGSFSPYDIHNTLVAAGPDFRAGWRDPLPSGNVDVAPTIAALLHLDLPPAQGRVLREALRGGLGEAAKDFRVTPGQLRPSQAATGLETVRIDGSRLGATRFSFSVHVKDVKSPDGGTWRYYDFARPDRH